MQGKPRIETPRETVRRALRFEEPGRIPRDLWLLPIAERRFGPRVGALRRRFPPDIDRPLYHDPAPALWKGDPYRSGVFVDEWGARFVNLQDGIIGEVKEPLLEDWGALARLRPPFGLIGRGMGDVDRSAAASDRFLLACACPRPFERMQFLRGTENILMDVVEQPPAFFRLRDLVHAYYTRELEAWARTDVDGLMFMDDWGAQSRPLIPPDLWRTLFKPLYRDYCAIAHGGGKFAFMHSDGFIDPIYEDLIEIGVDALNSQLFCMDIEAIGRRFRGRITFWGELDRQRLLPFGTEHEVRAAVRRVTRALWDGRGGLIAQCELGAGTRIENVEAAFAEWERLSPRPG